MKKCEDDKGTDCEDVTTMLDRVTAVTGKGQWNLTCFVY